MDREKLQKELESEMENLARLNCEMKQLLAKIDDKPSFIEIRAAGSILHDFYCGIEKIFQRIALSIDANLPQGEDWHTELLLQMAKPFKGIRDSLVTGELLQNLKEYLRFRHLFRHIYGFELRWERFKELCVELEGIFKELDFEIKQFMKGLGRNV